ncbi:hypothetical protein A3732_19570 [Oleiphilus sp. HI0050]|nr:hypothetical protein A3732_19570 [Oleiphilus sp. HI0050]
MGDRAGCDYLDLTQRRSSEDCISKNFRNNLRKASKKFAITQDIEIETSKDKGKLPSLYQEFLRVESSGWKGGGGTATAIALNSELVAFYEELVNSSGQGYYCEISIIGVFQGSCRLSI